MEKEGENEEVGEEEEEKLDKEKEEEEGEVFNTFFDGIIFLFRSELIILLISSIWILILL